MIKRLRKRFIKIATLSVVLVMALLVGILNTANVLSVNSDLKNALTMISENPDVFTGNGSFEPHPMPIGPGELEPIDPGHDLPQEGVSLDGLEPGYGPGPEGADHGKNDGNWHRPVDRTEDKGEWDFSGKDGRYSKETPFSLRFFTIEFGEDGELLSSYLGNIASVSSENVEEYLSVAAAKGNGFGFYNGYKYYVYETESGSRGAVFLSAFNEVRNCRKVLIVSSLAAAACILLVYVLVVIFSKKAIDPLVKNAERQKQFITDASHELKTPLTVINTSLSVLEMEVGRQKWIDKAQDQTEKMSDLINSLVTLSKMDEEETAVNAKEFAVSDAVKETAESFRDTAEAKGFKLKTDIEEGLVYKGDEYMIRRLVSILLENALKYTSPEGTIKLSLSKSRKGIVIKESNPCEGLDKEELPKLFDRFYRADKARTSGNGFGVGLSIARSIAEAHRGEISASSPKENEILFTAELK